MLFVGKDIQFITVTILPVWSLHTIADIISDITKLSAPQPQHPNTPTKQKQQQYLTQSKEK